MACFWVAMSASFLAIFLILLSQQPTGIIADCEGMTNTFGGTFIVPKTADNGGFVKHGARFKTSPGKCFVCNTTEWSDKQSNGAMLDDYCKPCQDMPSTSIDVETSTRQTKKCGKRKEPAFKPRELISRGTTVEDIAKWPWLVALKVEYLAIRHNGKEEVGVDVSTDEYASAKMLSTTIYAGRSNFMEEDAQKSVVLEEDVIVHEKYIIKEKKNHHHKLSKSSNIHIDLALLKVLSQPLDFNDRVLPICLNSSSHEVGAGTVVHIAGWGLTEEVDIEGVQIEGNTPPKYLHEGIAKILSMEDCLKFAKKRFIHNNPDEPKSVVHEYMNTQRELYKNRLCIVGMDRSNTQKGDSGGALLYFDTEQGGHWSNIGVLSFRFWRESKEEAPAAVVFAKIDADACRWISEKTGGIVGCGK